MDLSNYELIIHSKLTLLLGGSLPYQGIISGPGMTALLLSILWERDIEVEGLDLYTDWPDEPENIYAQSTASKPLLNDEIYPPVLPNGICIRSSSSKGILTRHVIEKQQSVFGKDRTLLILHTLDLNAFGVGYDCYSQKLSITTEFEEFCSSRQLRIQSPVNAESLMLLFKYRKKYDAFIDADEELHLLTGYRRSCLLRGETNGYNDLITEEGKMVFDQFRQALEPLCSISVESEQPVLPGLEHALELTYRLSFNGNISIPPSYPVVSDLLKKAEMEFDSYSFLIYHKYCVRRGTSNALKSRFMLALSRPITACMVLLNPLCLRHYITDRHVTLIDNFYKVHPGCVRILLGLNLDVFSMATSIQVIIAFAKKNGNIIIGLIETHHRVDYILNEICWESLEQLLEAYRATAGTPLLDKTVNLEAFEYREFITELTTTTELECEGWKMKHCVGGYAPAVASNQGRTRIFHIDGNKPSTAAIYFNAENKELTYEVYGIANCDPVPEHTVITEHLGRFLINTLWSDRRLPHDENIYEYVA